MDNLLNPALVQEYAKRTTSYKYPIEAKYVNAFICSLINSKAMISAYDVLKSQMWNDDNFNLFISYWEGIGEFNKEPYRSIISYSMMKKDEFLFKTISSLFFTGRMDIIYSLDFSKKSMEYTDENDSEAYCSAIPTPVFVIDQDYYAIEMRDDDNIYTKLTESSDWVKQTPEHWTDITINDTWKIQDSVLYVKKQGWADFMPAMAQQWKPIAATNYTDMATHTDSIASIPYITFWNIFCDDEIPDASITEKYQTSEEMFASVEKFNRFITICKPARAEIIMLYEPYCYLSGNASTVVKAGINDVDFKSPFGDSASYNALYNMTTEQLKQCYSVQNIVLSGVDNMGKTVEKSKDNIDATVTFIEGAGYMIFRYEIRTSDDPFLWGTIKFPSGVTGIKDIQITPDNIITQKMEEGVTLQTMVNQYFILFDVKFPRP